VDNVAAAASLGYTETTWNILGSAAIEETAFSALSRAQRQSAILLGFNEESWDCDQNHYGGYDWSELVLYDLDKYFTALGWTRRMWRLDSVPASYNLPWNRLTDAQQEAAWELCYFEESWDGISIDTWEQADTVGGSKDQMVHAFEPDQKEQREQQHVIRGGNQVTGGSEDQMPKLVKIDESDQQQQQQRECCLCDNCGNPRWSLLVESRNGGFLTCNTLAKDLLEWDEQNLINMEACEYYQLAYAPRCC